MNRGIVVGCILLGIVLIGCEEKPLSSSKPSEVSSVPKVIVEKEKMEKPLPPPEVKIRLKRDAKDGYSWELNGSDVEQILKVNERLKRQLGGEQK